MRDAKFPRRGEIWLVEFPDDPKSRPALIVSLDAPTNWPTAFWLFRSPPTCASPTHVALPAKQGGLMHDSMARCENVSYLHKARLSRGPLAGTISPALMRDVELCPLRSLGITA